MSRPPKPINWELVEKAIESGCTAAEIAGKCRIDINTFYDRFKQNYGYTFADSRERIYSSGDFDLKLTVHLKALKGVPSVLLRYCEERLGWGKTEDKVPANQNQIEIDHRLMLLEAKVDAYKAKYGDLTEAE